MDSLLRSLELLGWRLAAGTDPAQGSNPCHAFLSACRQAAAVDGKWTPAMLPCLHGTQQLLLVAKGCYRAGEDWQGNQRAAVVAKVLPCGVWEDADAAARLACPCLAASLGRLSGKCQISASLQLQDILRLQNKHMDTDGATVHLKTSPAACPCRCAGSGPKAEVGPRAHNAALGRHACLYL